MIYKYSEKENTTSEDDDNDEESVQLNDWVRVQAYYLLFDWS